VISFGQPPGLLNNKMINLRNDVIHKGKLPNKSEAIAFGGEVYELIQDGVLQLRKCFLDQVNKILGEHVNRTTEKMGDRYPRAF
jgi:hypothetical protein